MRIAVLALQGAFIEHEAMLHRLGVETFEVRQAADWTAADGLIIPGGESTVMVKLLHELQLFEPVRRDIEAGLPVFGTCAGLILLGQGANTLSTMDIEVRRNAYGRQLGSFHTEAPIAGVEGGDVPMTFIRAPFISHVFGRAEAIATVDGHIVAARQGNQLVTAFHPELDDDTRIHHLFLNTIQQARGAK